MAGQERKAKPTSKRDDETTEVAEVAAPAKQGEKIKEELDDLLDEIDSVLEENAEEFVRNYIQKGGE
jgi:prokaryotic ubiquitin-like protein Pup